MRSRRITSKLAGALAAAALACLPFPGGAADPYEINVIIPLTGPGAFLGKDEASALNILAESVNKTGGIGGRPLKFVIYDDQTNPQVAVELTNAVIAKKVPVILGSTLVANCNAMAPLAPNGPVIYCFSPGFHPAQGSYYFSSSISTYDFTLVAIRYMRERGWKKFASITANDATGQDADKSFDAAIALPENASMALIDREHFNPTDISVAAQMARIKASGAQVAILWATGTPFGTLLREAVQSGLAIPLVGTASNLNAQQLEAYQSFLPETLYIMAPPWSDPSRVTNRPVKRYIDGYLNSLKNAGVKAGMGHSLAWDPAAIVVEALRKYGPNATAAQIRDYIISVRGFVGINGVYDFKQMPQRGIGLDWVQMIRYDKAKNGFVTVSKPGGVPL